MVDLEHFGELLDGEDVRRAHVALGPAGHIRFAEVAVDEVGDELALRGLHFESGAAQALGGRRR